MNLPDQATSPLASELEAIKVVYAMLGSIASLLAAQYLLLALGCFFFIFKHHGLWCLVLMLAVTGYGHYVYLRLHFDQGLLKQLLTAAATQDLARVTEQMDEALLSLKLLSTAKAGRVWCLRLHGILTGFKRLIACLILQVGLLSGVMLSYAI